MSDDEDTVIGDGYLCDLCGFVWESESHHFRKVHQQTTTLRYTNGKSFDDGDSKKLITADDNRVRTSHPKRRKTNPTVPFFVVRIAMGLPRLSRQFRAARFLEKTFPEISQQFQGFVAQRIRRRRRRRRRRSRTNPNGH